MNHRQADEKVIHGKNQNDSFLAVTDGCSHLENDFQEQIRK